MMISIKKNIPNFITACNLLFGYVGIIHVCNDNLIISAYMIFAGAVCDFLDGLLARLSKVSSDIGKQLDSLADLVTFGVLPGLIIYKLIVLAHVQQPLSSNLIPEKITFNVSQNSVPLLAFVSFVIPIFSAIRLAKFNIDINQKDKFIGLPTPANALFIASLALIKTNPQNNSTWEILFSKFILSYPFLVTFTFIFSFFLIMPVPMIALKFKNLTWHDNKPFFCFIALSLVMVVLLKFLALPVIILSYILLSFIMLVKK